MTETLDRIERQIDINATPQRVWDLVSSPGWFINDGTIEENEISYEGDLAIVRHPVHGTFPLRTERLDPPRYAAFRWLSAETEEQPAAEQSTLVEFWVEDNPAGGVTLRVAESGFSSLSVSEEERRKKVEENTEGWEIELAAARSFLDPVAAEASRSRQ